MLIYVLLSFMFLFSGCLGRNVTEGDADYPVQNSAPTRVTKVSGYLSPDLDVRFEAIYAADQPWAPKDDSCGYYESFSRKYQVGLQPFSLHLPLEIAREGDQYSFSIAADHFLPGRCNWQLADIHMYLAPNSNKFYPCLLYYPNTPGTLGVPINIRCKPIDWGGTTQTHCNTHDKEYSPPEKRSGSIYFGPGPSEQIMNIRGTQHTNAT